MVASSGIILIRRDSFVRALRGRARPEGAPLQGAHNAEPGLSARDNTNDLWDPLLRARALSPGTRHRHTCGVSSPRPERARSAGCALTGRTTTPSPGSQPG